MGMASQQDRFAVKIRNMRRAQKRTAKLFSEAVKTVAVVFVAERNGKRKRLRQERKYLAGLTECLVLRNTAGKQKEFREKARAILKPRVLKKKPRLSRTTKKTKNFKQMWEQVRATHKGTPEELQQLYLKMLANRKN